MSAARPFDSPPRDARRLAQGARIGRIACLVLLVAVAIVAFAEGVARVAFDAPSPPYVRNALVGTEWAPGSSFERLSIDDPPVRFTLEVNPLGFRGKAMRTPEKPPDTYRIFFIGASTTENAYLPEERTFAGRVQTALDERLRGSPPVEVANAGVAGANAAFVFSRLVNRVLPHAPDLVVLLEGHNDMSDALSDQWDPLGEPRPEKPPRLKDWLVGASRLVALLERARTRSSERDHRWWYEKRRRERRAAPFTPEGAVDPKRGLGQFRAWLRRFAAICAEEKVALALMTQPSLYKLGLSQEEERALHMGHLGAYNYDTKALIEVMDAYNEVVREVARERGLILVDAARAVPQDLASLSDDVHLTSKGNEAVARAVIEQVLKDGKLPSPKK